MSRKARVPGMASRSFAIPECSIHGREAIQKNDQGEWFCVTCFDLFLNQQLGGKTAGGVALPAGVEAGKKPSILDIMPNRRWRRHAR